MEYLKHLVQDGKLPKLSDLGLEGNGLFQMKKELRQLVETCVTNHPGLLSLHLTDNGLPIKYKKQLKKICKGTNSHVDF